MRSRAAGKSMHLILQGVPVLAGEAGMAGSVTTPGLVSLFSLGILMTTAWETKGCACRGAARGGSGKELLVAGLQGQVRVSRGGGEAPVSLAHLPLRHKLLEAGVFAAQSSIQSGGIMTARNNVSKNIT